MAAVVHVVDGDADAAVRLFEGEERRVPLCLGAGDEPTVLRVGVCDVADDAAGAPAIPVLRTADGDAHGAQLRLGGIVGTGVEPERLHGLGQAYLDVGLDEANKFLGRVGRGVGLVRGGCLAVDERREDVAPCARAVGAQLGCVGDEGVGIGEFVGARALRAVYRASGLTVELRPVPEHPGCRPVGALAGGCADGSSTHAPAVGIEVGSDVEARLGAADGVGVLHAAGGVIVGEGADEDGRGVSRQARVVGVDKGEEAPCAHVLDAVAVALLGGVHIEGFPDEAGVVEVGVIPRHKAVVEGVEGLEGAVAGVAQGDEVAPVGHGDAHSDAFVGFAQGCLEGGIFVVGARACCKGQLGGFEGCEVGCCAAGVVHDAVVVVAVARAGCHKGSQRGVGGCLVGCLKVLEGDALELERAEAETRLARHVDDNAERHLGFLRQGEADAAVAEHVPGEGFRFAIGIAHELRAVVHDDAAGLRGCAVAEGTREGVAPCGQADGLPEAVVVQLVGKVAPDGLDGDVVAMRGIDVGACDDVAVLDLVQFAPGAALGAHLEAQEAAAVGGVDGARGGVVGTLVVGEVRRRDVACGGCVEVEGEDAEGRVPGIAVGAEVDARGIEGVRRTVGDVAPALVEVVIDAQGVSGFGSSHVRDGSVAIAAQGVGAEGAVPEAELVQQAVEAVVGVAYGKVVPGRGGGDELVCGRSEQDAVAPELHGAGVIDEGIVVPLAQHDVALA